MARLRNNAVDFIVISGRNGDVVHRADNLPQAEAEAIRRARDERGRDYFVAQTISRFGLPEAEPQRNVLPLNDLEQVAPPEAPDQRPHWLVADEFDPELLDDEDEV